MKRKIELLAPGGDIDSIKAAIISGADAVYCGLNKFNARNRATNITFEDLNGILRLAHSNDCQVFITLNIIIVESEIPDLIRLLNKLINTNVDGVIIQDLGLFYLLSKYFGSLKIHASTQLTTHNEGQIKFLRKLNASRVNLSRELNVNEIKALTSTAHKINVLTEVFVHGSYCISFSGLCYMSSLHGGNSANRGRCSQPCRDQYKTTSQGIDFPLNLKDNSAYTDLKELYNIEVDSIKIEGRIKKFHYVYMVVKSYRKQLQNLYDNNLLSTDNSNLYKVFNRDFSNGFLKGDINKNMFIENPRDNSSIHLAKLNGGTSDEDIEKAEKELYKEKGDLRSFIKNKTDQLSIAKAPLTITISGKSGTPLKVAIKTPDSSFVLFSEMNLVTKGTLPLNLKMILKKFKAINDTEYIIEHIELKNLQPNLFITFNELTSIKNRILFILKDSKETHSPIKLPVLKRHKKENVKPTISVLISSKKDLNLCNESSADIYFQLPNDFTNKSSEFVDLFIKNKKLIPWFPSVLIGKGYSAAVKLLQQLQPKLIVTNNTGIAYEANEMGIFWIAGPYLNIVNSYSLLCLKEKFNCSGSFVSNEINKHQIRSIKKPDDFKLYYSIYHPIVLMTSRQCLFHQVIGCEKDSVDEKCIGTCNRSATITNLKKVSFIIDKSKGEYNNIYNETNFLNTDIVTDLPDIFSSFFIDLRDIKTETKIEIDKLKIIKLFENHLSGDYDTKQQLKQIIHPTNNTQYKKGI
ncbi:MAG: peptidase U32 family protein [Bacteroidota bacterium]